jgi:hypothetical protein
MYQPYMSSPGWLEGASGMFRKRPATNVPVVAIRRGVPQIQHDPDPCNRFLTCSACVGQREGQFQCGWCMGGTIVYNDTGDSGLHCAGFIASQPALPFYCPLDFRTEDCTGTCVFRWSHLRILMQLHFLTAPVPGHQRRHILVPDPVRGDLQERTVCPLQPGD